MVIKRSIIKDAFKSLKSNYKSFISILLISFVASFIFIGLNTIKKDIKLTAYKSYSQNNMMDIKLESNELYNLDVINKIKSLDNIKGVMSVKTSYLDAKINAKTVSLLGVSINKDKNLDNDNYINRLSITNGSYPTTISEGLINEAFAKEYNIKIGTMIKLSSKYDDLRAKKIRITGFVKDSYFTNKNYNGFIYMQYNNFTNDYYSDIFITVKDKKLINDTKNLIKKETAELINTNINDKKESVKSEIESINNELAISDDKDSLNKRLELQNSILNELENSKSEFLTNDDLMNSLEYENEIKKIDSISKLYTYVFLIICAITSSFITFNIIDKDNNKIGTLSSFGYNNFYISFKYVLFSLVPAVIGIVIGFISSSVLMPNMISSFYGLSYNMPVMSISFDIKYLLIVILIWFIISTILTLLKMHFKLKSDPASLILNIKSKNKFNVNLKHVLLAFIISILLTMSLSVNKSVTYSVDKQFNKIEVYDAKADVSKKYKKNILISEKNVLVNDESATLIIPKNVNKLNDFITVKKIDNKGITVSKNLVNELNVKKNDKVKLVIDNKEYKVKVSNITNNYVNNYVYLSPTLYKKLTNKNVSYNTKLVINAKKNDNDLKYKSEIKEAYLKNMYTYIYISSLFNLSSFVIVILLYNALCQRKNIFLIRYVNKNTFNKIIPFIIVGIIIGMLIGSIIIKKLSLDLVTFKYHISLLNIVLVFIISSIFTLMLNINEKYVK